MSGYRSRLLDERLVPHRGQRNEPAFVVHVLQRLAQAYGISEEELAECTNENVKRVFGVTGTDS